MDFCPSKTSWHLWLLAAALAALPVSAQQSAGSSKASDSSAKASVIPIEQQNLFDLLPGAQTPTPVSPEQVMEWQKLLDNKKNWTLLTPEEILGVPTAEKILGLPEPDDEKNLTVTERYLKRLNDQEQSVSATNALRLQNELFPNEGPNQPGKDGSGRDALAGL